MDKNSVMACVLISVLALFMIFSYMPSVIELSALENERQVFLQLENKVKELEQKLINENLLVKPQLTSVRKQLQEQMVAEYKSEKVSEGNRGYLIKDGKTQ